MAPKLLKIKEKEIKNKKITLNPLIVNPSHGRLHSIRFVASLCDAHRLNNWRLRKQWRHNQVPAGDCLWPRLSPSQPRLCSLFSLCDGHPLHNRRLQIPIVFVRQMSLPGRRITLVSAGDYLCPLTKARHRSTLSSACIAPSWYNISSAFNYHLQAQVTPSGWSPSLDR